MEGEETLEEAREFSSNLLRKRVDYHNKDIHIDGIILIDEDLLSLVRHALELPLHWRVPRLNARWYIEAYEKRQHTNPLMLELAKLEFNMAQATYQQELKHVSR